MKQAKNERDNIVAALVRTLEPLDYVHAVWEGGAASFNRVDEWSDIDLYVVCDDDQVENTFVTMEQALGALSEIELKFRLPEPTWHGHSQAFWRLKNISPFLFLDIAVMKKSSKDKFLQYSIHGRPLVHFDKIGVVKDDPVDREDYFQGLKARLDMLKTNFELFQVLVLKELNRGNDVEALSYYLSYTYRPLVEVLRIKHCPWHHRFFTTYIYYEMPSEVVKRLHHLYFITSAEALKKCREEAADWFWETVKGIDYEEVRRMIFEPEN